MKKITAFICLFCISKSLIAQTTLERNSNARSTPSQEVSLDNVLFEYQSLFRNNTFDINRIDDRDVKIDSTLISRNRITIDSIRRLFQNNLSAIARDTINKNLEIEILKKQLNEKSFDLLKAKAEAIQNKLTAVKDSLDEIEFNTRKLSYFSWDIFNQIDSTKEVKNKEKFFDSLTIFRSRFDRFYERTVYRDLDSIDKISEVFRDLNSFSLSLNDSAMLSDISKKLQKLEERYKANKQQLENFSSYWNGLINRNILKKEKEKKIEVTALPFFNSIPGLKDFNGTLSIFGNNRPKPREGVYVEFGAYTGILGSSDELSHYNLFIPEVSTYGFFFKNNFSLKTNSDSITRLGLNTAFYYLGKKVKPDTLKSTQSLSTSLFQFKFGLEYVLVKDLFSVYSNIGAQSFVTNRNDIKAAFNTQKDIIGTVDFGFRMLLNPAQSVKIDDWKIYFDLNFIVNNGDTKSIGQSDDFVITNFRVGLRKELGRP